MEERVKIGSSRERKLKRIISYLKTDGVNDEIKAIRFYTNMAKELRSEGFEDLARALELIVRSESSHRDILSNAITAIEMKIIANSFTKETTLKKGGGVKEFFIKNRR